MTWAVTARRAATTPGEAAIRRAVARYREAPHVRALERVYEGKPALLPALGLG